MNKWLHGVLALVAFFTFSIISPLTFSGEEKKEEKKDKGGKVVIFGDDKKDDKKDKEGK